MASEVANTVIGKVTEPLIDAVWRQIEYAWNCNDYIDDLRSKVDKLKHAQGRVEHLIDEAEKRGQKIEPYVHDWLEDVKKFIVKADEFLQQENEAKEKCFVGLCRPWKARHRIGRRAKKEMLPDADKLKENREAFADGVSYHESVKGIQPVKGYKVFESREPIFKDIMLALQDPDVTKIGVYGINGVGKTTMVRAIAAKAERENLFQDVVMATVFQEQNMKEIQGGEEVVKQTLDLRRIQGEIKDGLDFEFNKETESGRADELRNRLKDEKRKKLVILDNIWAGLELEDVGIPSDDQGCKILMTSTNQNVLSEMGSKKNFTLDVLRFGEARSWFKEMVGDVVVKDPTIEAVANKVADKCARLPILLVTVANGLKDKRDLSAWNNALSKLSRYDNEDMHERADLALRFSYNKLKGNEIKSLFLLCAQLRPGFITISSLLRYAKGLGLFKNCNTLKETKSRLLSFVQDLKASSLLLEGYRHELLKMHDIVHSFAVSVASKRHNVFTVAYGNEMQKWPEDDDLKRYTAISLPNCKIPELPVDIACPKLKSFILLSKDSSIKIPDNFFRKMKKLRVLDLTKITFLSLPSSLQFLMNLRTLCLDQCTLEGVPNMALIGKLKNLEILSFSGSDIIQLPMEIAELNCLQLLDLSNCRRLDVIPPNVLSCLAQLEDLHMENVCLNWGLEGKNAKLAELELLPNLNTLDIHITDQRMLSMGLFSKRLDRFRIFIGDAWDWSGEYKTLKTLKLKVNTDILSRKGIQMLLKEAEDLYLEELKGVQNSVSELDSQGFPQLKHLHIENSHEIQYIINSLRMGPAVFTKLESLFLDNLKNLKKIYVGQLMAESFGNLKILKLGSCNALKYLFSSSMARSLLCLEEINIKNCKILESIVMEESEDDTDRDEAIKLPQLQTLMLKSLPQFMSFCSTLKSPSSHTKQTPLETDGRAKEIVSESEPKTPLTLFSRKVFCPKLKNLKLSSINIEKIWHDQVLEISSCFHDLTSLIVDGCNNLKHLLSSTMVESLSNLNYLEISNCRTIGQIIVSEGFEEKRTLQQLDYLELKNLPKLTQFCACNLLECPALRNLWIENCPELRTFVSNSIRENIVASSEAEKINFVLFDEKVSFPNLDDLEIHNMARLTLIWHNELHEDSFCKLNWLSIQDAEELKSVFPYGHFLSRFKNLEYLYVTSCDSLEELLDVQTLINVKEVHEMTTSSLRSLLLRDLPNLKRIWNKGALEYLSFQNLSTFRAFNCPNMKSVFPATMAKGLSRLRMLVIEDCGVEEVISKEEEIEPMDRFEFPKLTELKLQKLPHFKRFYPGKGTIEWLALEKLDVSDCDKIDIFAIEPQNSEGVLLDNQPECSFQQPLFTAEKVIPNLEELPLNRKDAKMIQNGQFSASLFHKVKVLYLQSFHDKSTVFTSDLIERFNHLEKLVLRNSCFTEVFSHEGLACTENQKRILPQIQHLTLDSLSNLKHIQLDHVIENLKRLEVQNCGSLISLAPSSASFRNLTSISVCNCERLANLVTFSTAQSLVQLTEISITGCNMMKEIVVSSEDEVKDEITFQKLETLNLNCLTSLTSFCSESCTLKFPSLEEVIVSQCPKMYVFSRGVLHAPKLRKVRRKRWGKKRWHGDLNATIEMLYAELAGFKDLQHLKLSEFPELKGRWPDQFPVRFLDNLLSLVVDDCASYWNAVPSNLLPFLNVLKELEVRNCDSVEEVIDQEQPNAGDVWYLSRLNKFHLIDLPRLRHVWNENPRGNLNFRNLKLLKVHNCSSLRNIFTPTMVMGLVKLQEIEVNSCPMVEEIIAKGAVQDVKIFNITFPLLNSIILESLPRLTSFYPGNGIVECLSVKKIAVVDCPRKFTSTFVRGQEPSAPNETTESKVAFPNLEKLRVDWNDTMEEFWNGQFQAEFFFKLKDFELIRVPNNYSAFPSHFLQRLPSLENLAVSDAFFKEIVLHEQMNDEEGHLGVLTQIRELKLFKLPNLMLLSNKDMESCRVFQNLETLKVSECCRMKILVPSSVSFSRLNTLEVSKCHGLINLINSSTAKSLEQLMTMKVTECELIEEIVTNEEDETETEVIFEKLKYLELNCLPSFISFYSGKSKFMFPSLEEVQVSGCPKMNFFSHGVVSMPKLKKLQLAEGEDKGSWEGNLNAPIQHLFIEMGHAVAQSKPPSPPQQTNLNFEIAEAEENNMLAVSEGQASEGFHAGENLDLGKDLPSKVRTTIKLTTKDSQKFSSEKDESVHDKIMPASTAAPHFPALEQDLLSKTPTRVTETSSLSPENFEAVFVSVEELLKPSQEPPSQPVSIPGTHTEFHKFNEGSSENYGYAMDVIRRILKKNLTEVATSADALLLLTNLKKLKNCPHLSSEQSETIQDYIKNFESLVTYHPNYVQQIGMSSTLKFSIDDNKKGIAELKTLYDDFTSRTANLSTSKEELKKRLQEIEGEEDRIRANMEVLFANLVTRKGDLEMNLEVFPEAVRQQKEAEIKANRANHSWAKMRTLFP